MNLDKESGMPLYAQIRDDIHASILQGILSPGTRLPSVQAMAHDRQVTQATIRRALQDLIEDGLVESHVGRGTFVTRGAHPNQSHTLSARPRSIQIPDDSLSKSIEELLSLSSNSACIAFTRGIGDTGTLPEGILSRLAHKALSRGESLFWDSGDSRGLPELRESISRMYSVNGYSVRPEQVLITSGSQQAITLVAQQAAHNGTPVLCESPCYAGVINSFNAFGLSPKTLSRDEDGIHPDSLASVTEPSLLYLCPLVHNPMGTDISPAKHQAIADWATRTGSILLSDEIFRDLHFSNDAHSCCEQSSFLFRPGLSHAIILGSLSKSFISGLRVGWIVSSEDKIASLARIKRAMDLGCPPLMQGIALAFLEDEHGYKAHRLRMITHYQEKRDATLQALADNMPSGVTWTYPSGGFQLWLTLPPGASSLTLLPLAIDAGVSFLPGPLQDSEYRCINSLRLCYGSLSPAEISEGIRRLAKVIRMYLTERHQDPIPAGIGDY